jgi:hypothetical protein
MPCKPLRFKGAINGRFARKGKATRREGPPTNLGVRSSNLFGRAREFNDLVDLGAVVLGRGVTIRVTADITRCTRAGFGEADYDWSNAIKLLMMKASRQIGLTAQSCNDDAAFVRHDAE